MSVDINYLADQPQHVDTLAAWHFAQWSYMHPGQVVQDRINEFQQHLGKRQVPTTFVATENGVLFGSASLTADDLPPRNELTPWLASVYVDPPHRGRGVASALVRRVAEEAKSIGFERFYLFTPDAAPLYARLGWEEFERMKYGGEEITLMRLELQPG